MSAPNEAASLRWTDLSWDPNAADVLAHRQSLLTAARRAPVESRVALLRQLAAGRRVLDIGVVEHDAINEQSDRWLHRHLAEVAASCRGVDVLQDGVAALQEKGYDVICHDVISSPLPDRFDLIVAGDVIEHVGNPEGLMRASQQMLAPGGRLVLSTPNPYMLHRVWHHLRGRAPDSVDHVVLLAPSNLAELAERVGLRLDAWRGVKLKNLPGWRNRIASLARAALIRLGGAPELACDTLVYEFVER